MASNFMEQVLSSWHVLNQQQHTRRGIEDRKQKSEDKYNQIHISHTPNTVLDSLRQDKTFERPAPYKMHLHSKSATRSRAIVMKIIVILLISLYMLRFNTKGFKFVSYLLRANGNVICTVDRNQACYYPQFVQLRLDCSQFHQTILGSNNKQFILLILQGVENQNRRLVGMDSTSDFLSVLSPARCRAARSFTFHCILLFPTVRTKIRTTPWC